MTCIIASYSHPFPAQRSLVTEPCAFGTLLVCSSCGETHVRVDGCSGCAAQWKLCEGFVERTKGEYRGK